LPLLRLSSSDPQKPGAHKSYMAILFIALLASRPVAVGAAEAVAISSSGQLARRDIIQHDHLRAERERQAKQAKIHAEEEPTFPVDFVYCWAGEAVQHDVGSDGLAAADVEGDHNVGQGFGELRYSIRYLEANAPWFNKVFILTNTPAQRPAWLTEASKDKIEMIDRCGLFPRAQDCPTKNTDACRAVMHKIPGLSEHFVDLDDDFLLLRPLEVSDFFTSQGQPLVLPAYANKTHEKLDIYSGIHPGPDMPPDHRPSRMRSLHHLPLPLTLSFASRMESTYSDWYAFVRSHHTRFICCNASKVGNGLDESFRLIYPHMLLEWNVGVVNEIPPFATCNPLHDDGGHVEERAAFLKCMMNKVQGLPQAEDTWAQQKYLGGGKNLVQGGPKPKYMALQNIGAWATWAAVQKAMEAQLADVAASKLVAEPKVIAEALLPQQALRAKLQQPHTVAFYR